MTTFYVLLAVWLGSVACWAIVIQPYAELRPIDRIHRGYLLWNENWDINHRSRGYYHLLGLYRYWWQACRPNKARLVKTKRAIRDHEQLNPHKFAQLKKNGYLF